jgi:hypothetical protein
MKNYLISYKSTEERMLIKSVVVHNSTMLNALITFTENYDDYKEILSIIKFD